VPAVERRVVLAPVTSDGGTAPSIPADSAAAYALGLEWWSAGRTDDAFRAFHTIIEKLVWHGKQHIEPGAGGDVMRVRERVLIPTEGGVLLASATTGKIERFMPLGEYVQLTKLGSSLVGVTSGDDIALLDVDRSVVVDRIAQVSMIARGTNVFVAYGNQTDGPHVEVWSPNALTRLYSLRDVSPVESVSMVTFSAGDRYLVVLDMGHGAVFDAATGDRVVSYEEAGGRPMSPGVSEDGRLLAYGHVDLSASQPVGNSYLYDTQARKVIAMSHAVPYPCSYSFGGKYLAVGDLRRACLLAVPSMKLVACSAEVRPKGSVDDDLQDAYGSFIQSASALVIETSDGSALVAKVPSMATIWKGRAHFDTDGVTSYLVDVDNHDLLTIGPGGVPVRARTLAEDESPETLRETHPRNLDDDAAITRASKAVCHVGTWVFPLVACAL
jgi:hypothetical protein